MIDPDGASLPSRPQAVPWKTRTAYKMPRKKRDLILSEPVREGLKTFKVRLDARTVITLASRKAFEFWKQKYPNAVIIG